MKAASSLCDRHKVKRPLFVLLSLLVLGILGCGGKPVTVTSIAVHPDLIDENTGQSVNFTATATYSDGHTAPVSVRWSSAPADWVQVNGSTATCLSPAPVVDIFGPETWDIQAELDTTDKGALYAIGGLICI